MDGSGISEYGKLFGPQSFMSCCGGGLEDKKAERTVEDRALTCEASRRCEGSNQAIDAIIWIKVSTQMELKNQL